jgi:N-formylglutamate amidohydrolase
MCTAVVVHVPHASAAIPEHEIEKLAITGGELEAELLRMTDWFTDELFDVGRDIVGRARFPISRLIVDPERLVDDDAEPMAGRGMGVVYTRTSDGRPLRSSPDAKERERLLEAYYFPHHEMLERLVREALTSSGQSLIIDGHSFASCPLPCDLDQATARPDICIGTDPFHTPEELKDAAVSAFRDLGWGVELNRPYAGTIVPKSFHRRDARIRSIMVEINRALYMDEGTGERLSQFDEIAAKVQSAVETLIASTRGA